jgi:hypothetical protein
MANQTLQPTKNKINVIKARKILPHDKWVIGV